MKPHKETYEMMSFSSIPSSLRSVDRQTALPMAHTHTHTLAREHKRRGVSQLSHLRHKSHSASMISQRKLVDVTEMYLPSSNWERLV